MSNLLVLFFYHFSYQERKFLINVNINNDIILNGKLISEWQVDHIIRGSRFYSAKLEAARLSGVKDTINLIASDDLLNGRPSSDMLGSLISVRGQIRTFSRITEKKRHTKLSVLVHSIKSTEPLNDPKKDTENFVHLVGYVCKVEPYVRVTSAGFTVISLILDVHRDKRGHDYVPCVFWRKRAIEAYSFDIGEHLSIDGRLQSRAYTTRFGDNRTVHEVSVQHCMVLPQLLYA